MLHFFCPEEGVEKPLHIKIYSASLPSQGRARERSNQGIADF
jgi:hypothetical protein